MLPRDGRASAKRRLDYRPPAFLVPQVTLEFDLEPDATLVTATLDFRRNAGAAGVDPDAPLVLDGEQQQVLGVELDGAPVAAARLVYDGDVLRLSDPPAAGRLTLRSRIAPARNLALEGLYVSSGVFCTQCEPEGFRRITYLPRPSGRARDVHGDDPRRPRALSGAVVERQPASTPGRCPTAATSPSGTTRSRSRRTCSRWSPAISPRSRTRSRRCAGARCTSRSIRRRATCRAARTRWRR